MDSDGHSFPGRETASGTEAEKSGNCSAMLIIVTDPQ